MKSYSWWKKQKKRVKKKYVHFLGQCYLHSEVKDVYAIVLGARNQEYNRVRQMAKIMRRVVRKVIYSEEFVQGQKAVLEVVKGENDGK